MKISNIFVSGLSILTASFISLPSSADMQNGKQLDEHDLTFDSGSTSYFIGVRPWMTSWDVPLVDMKMVIINPVGPVAVLQTIPIQIESGNTTVPIIAFGARYGDLTISANISPRTSYSTSGLAASAVTRSETDINPKCCKPFWTILRLQGERFAGWLKRQRTA